MLTSKEQKKAADEISNSSKRYWKRHCTLEGNIETYGNIRIEGKV
jgi:hypothetical protein